MLSFLYSLIYHSTHGSLAVFVWDKHCTRCWGNKYNTGPCPLEAHSLLRKQRAQKGAATCFGWCKSTEPGVGPKCSDSKPNTILQLFICCVLHPTPISVQGTDSIPDNLRVFHPVLIRTAYIYIYTAISMCHPLTPDTQSRKIHKSLEHS